MVLSKVLINMSKANQTLLNRLLLTSILFITSMLSLPSYAINKCVSDDGKVSYQDMPCPDASEAMVVKVTEQNGKSEQSEIQVLEVLHQGMQYLVGVPKNWQGTVQVSQAGDASTLRVKPHSGSDMTLLMTFIKINPMENSLDELLDRVILETDMKYMTHGSDSKLHTNELSPLFLSGKVRLVNYVDPNLAKRDRLAKGEYAYVTAGALVSDELLINITILSNNLGSDNYAKAFAAVHTVNVRSVNVKPG